MFYLETVLAAILMLQSYRQLVAWGKLLQTGERNTVVFLYLIIIILVAECKRQHTLLLQVGFVNAGEALGEDHLHIEEARLHGCMLTR